MKLSARNFSGKLLKWFDQRGRTTLPWQQDACPYSIWVSEIMLQQTQVATVIPYYQKFMQRFPSVKHLADASLDEVLHLWTGLGYYARARNLHRAAGKIMADHGGELPLTVAGLQALPGIGRSTAGAVVALSARDARRGATRDARRDATDETPAILDGNVKRVLTRCFAIEGWPGSTATARQLWALAEELTPSKRLADYTQAIMDLGALVCKGSSPLCADCPFFGSCLAQGRGQVSRYPARKPRARLPVVDTFMLVIVCGDEVLLEQRPAEGLWGGLWGFPEPSANGEPSAPTLHSQAATFLQDAGLQDAGLEIAPKRSKTNSYSKKQKPAPIENHLQLLKKFRHSFTHYHLDITPVRIDVKPASRIAEPQASKRLRWYNPGKPDEIGLTGPVTKILEAVW